MCHTLFQEPESLHKYLCLSAPYYPQGKLMLVCHCTQFALGRNEEMTHSTLYQTVLEPSYRLTLTVPKYINNYLSHNSSHEKTTTRQNFSNVLSHVCGRAHVTSRICRLQTQEHFIFQRENAQLHFSMITDGYPPGITGEFLKIKQIILLVILLVLDVG